MDGSWIWDEYTNSTITQDTFCDDLTNHGLYFVFSGYVLPLISPRVRDWLKETLNSLKNNKIGGHIVTLTEFGFNKIQDIENNDEMKEYYKLKDSCTCEVILTNDVNEVNLPIKKFDLKKISKENPFKVLKNLNLR